MNLELTQEVEEVGFRLVEPSAKPARSFQGGLHPHITCHLGSSPGHSLTPEQRRIGQLEKQNQRLMQEVQMWKNASLSFAHELRASRYG